MTEIVTIERRADRSVFWWLLPLWFAIGAVLAVQWPGHGFQLFSIGALPGVWAAFLLGTGESAFSWLLPTLLAGGPLLLLLGRMLDGVGTDLLPWLLAVLVVAAVAGYFLLGAHADLETAFERHGGLLPYAVCSLQLGSYGATLLLLIIGAGRGRRR
ncbi:MAG: hypothetical protein KAI24_14110 [Planctomycetes bacterium]|nr:hypothetical protein [Planctomycetota bacterium]